MILLTGFEPFGDMEVNPSQVIAERLDGAIIGGEGISSMVMPVVFGEDLKLIRGRLAESPPKALLSLGLDASADAVLIETLAHNRRNSEDGLIPIDTELASEMPATLPVKEMRKAIIASGVKCRFSKDAGTYLCNHIMFWGLRLAAESATPYPSGFVHIPLPREYSGASPAEFRIDQLERAVRAAILAIVTHLKTASSRRSMAPRTTRISTLKSKRTHRSGSRTRKTR